MTTAEKAQAYHAGGTCNCAQSVLCACCEYTGLDESTARHVAAGFGAGMRCGEMCGALSGAIMALGAASDGNGKPAGEVTPQVKKLVAAFKEKYGYVRCSDLLRDARQKRCDEFIGVCAGLVEQILEENKG